MKRTLLAGGNLLQLKFNARPADSLAPRSGERVRERGAELIPQKDGRKTGRLKCALSVAAIALLTSIPALADPIPRAVAAAADGPTLAALIRDSVPAESEPISGTLIIHRDHQVKSVRVLCKVEIHPDSWQSEYIIAATNDTPAEKLIVIHRTNAPNEFLYAKAGNATAELPKLEHITPEVAAETPLGGSDFSAGDLALDFLHWPQQQRLPRAMRLSQPCYVLESKNPAAKNIVRIRSYIDEESNAPIVAEAYDSMDVDSKHEVKEFSLHSSSFKRVNGRWQLENMDIKDLKKKSHTELKFDMQKE